MTEFRTSSYCQDGGCVAIAHNRDSVAVRDDKNPDGGQLVVSPAVWAVFVDSAIRTIIPKEET